jgi:type I restriction enzyme S subunit
MSQRERELAAFEELRQAEIAHAVTNGLNPDVPMRDSGIPWLGKIPAHWKLKQLRAYLKLVSIKGHGDKQLLSVTREQGVIVRNVDSKEENHNFIPDDLSGYKLIKPGQFAVNKMKSWQGSYGVSDYEGIVSPAYYVCDLNFPCKEFFSIAIRSKAYIPFFTQLSKGIRVDQWDLSSIALKSIYFAEPPIEEQQAIVDYINAKTAKIDGLIADLSAQIEKLKEYKQRLIADAVTGQISCKRDQSGGRSDFGECSRDCISNEFDVRK